MSGLFSHFSAFLVELGLGVKLVVHLLHLSIAVQGKGDSASEHDSLYNGLRVVCGEGVLPPLSIFFETPSLGSQKQGLVLL